MLRNLRPIRLSRRPEPFDSEEYLFELKIDGFRALAPVQDGKGELISRNGNVFRGFTELSTWIAEHLKVESAVLDGRSPALMEKAGQSSRICSCENRRASLSHSICSTSTEEICEPCH